MLIVYFCPLVFQSYIIKNLVYSYTGNKFVELIRSSSFAEYGIWVAVYRSLECASSEISKIHWFGLPGVHCLVATCWHFIVCVIDTLFLLNSHAFFLTTHVNITAAHRSITHSHVCWIHVDITEWLTWKWYVLVADVLVTSDTCVLVDALSHVEWLRCKWTFLHVLWSESRHWTLTLLLR